MRSSLALVLAGLLLAAGFFVSATTGSPAGQFASSSTASIETETSTAATTSTSTATSTVATTSACSAGYVSATIGGAHKCLRAGQFCSAADEADYEKYGFTCVDGHLKTATGPTTTTKEPPPPPPPPPPAPSGSSATPDPGQSVAVDPPTQTTGCTSGALPDRQCSPGAYYGGLTRTVICASSFPPRHYWDLPVAVRHVVEVEYGLAPRTYGRALEINRVIPILLGGSNATANLYPLPERLADHRPGYHFKNRLARAARRLVCIGKLQLHTARHDIAVNWIGFYRQVFRTYKRIFGVAPR